MQWSRRAHRKVHHALGGKTFHDLLPWLLPPLADPYDVVSVGERMARAASMVFTTVWIFDVWDGGIGPVVLQVVVAQGHPLAIKSDGGCPICLSRRLPFFAASQLSPVNS